jgi:hypothetical protein
MPETNRRIPDGERVLIVHAPSRPAYTGRPAHIRRPDGRDDDGNRLYRVRTERGVRLRGVRVERMAERATPPPPIYHDTPPRDGDRVRIARLYADHMCSKWVGLTGTVERAIGWNDQVRVILDDDSLRPDGYNAPGHPYREMHRRIWWTVDSIEVVERAPFVADPAMPEGGSPPRVGDRVRVVSVPDYPEAEGTEGVLQAVDSDYIGQPPGTSDGDPGGGDRYWSMPYSERRNVNVPYPYIVHVSGTDSAGWVVGRVHAFEVEVIERATPPRVTHDDERLRDALRGNAWLPGEGTVYVEPF